MVRTSSVDGEGHEVMQLMLPVLIPTTASSTLASSSANPSSSVALPINTARSVSTVPGCNPVFLADKENVVSATVNQSSDVSAQEVSSTGEM